MVDILCHSESSLCSGGRSGAHVSLSGGMHYILYNYRYQVTVQLGVSATDVSYKLNLVSLSPALDWTKSRLRCSMILAIFSTAQW